MEKTTCKSCGEYKPLKDFNGTNRHCRKCLNSRINSEREMQRRIDAEKIALLLEKRKAAASQILGIEDKELPNRTRSAGDAPVRANLLPAHFTDKSDALDFYTKIGARIKSEKRAFEYGDKVELYLPYGWTVAFSFVTCRYVLRDAAGRTVGGFINNEGLELRGVPQQAERIDG
jgi:hypothetical protein